jgi:hypothetical protein
MTGEQAVKSAELVFEANAKSQTRRYQRVLRFLRSVVEVMQS